jgi:hypothetical protein
MPHRGATFASEMPVALTTGSKANMLKSAANPIKNRTGFPWTPNSSTAPRS